MQPRIHFLTLGVADLTVARRFYEQGLGLPVWRSQGDIVMFDLGGLVLSLYPRHELAVDAGVPAEGPGVPAHGFRGLSVSHNVPQKEDVAALLETACAAGATIVQPAADVFWGGHRGYFADPDGHLWEVAWNPHIALGDDGRLVTG